MVGRHAKGGFEINLVSEEERTRTGRRPDLDKDLKWMEPFTAGGDAMSSADPCGEREFYPLYADVLTLAFGRNGGCAGNVINRYQQGGFFRAVE